MKVKLRACIAGTLALSTAAGAANAADTIQIGAPLELSGRFVAFGAAGKRGAEMALETFKGEVNGKKVEFLFRDIQSDPQAAVASINELTEQTKVKYIFGPIASVMFAAVIPAWRQQKPVWIGHGSVTTRTEEEVGGERRFFHTYPYAYHYHQTMSAGLKSTIGSGKKIVIVYSDDAYGRTSLPFARQFYKEAGFEIAGEELVRQGAADYNPILTKIRRLRPEVLVTLVQTSDLVTLAKQIKIAGINIPYLVDGLDVLLEEWQKAAGDAQEGWIGLSGYIHGMERPASKDRPDIFPSLSDWEKRFRDKYQVEPTYLDAGAYSAASLLLMALEKAGDDPDKVVEELEKLNTETLVGPGRFTKTSTGGTVHQAFENLMIAQRQNGKSIILYPPEVKTGEIKARTE